MTANTTAVILVIVAIILVAALAWYFLRQRRSHALRSHFGPEYDHAVHQYGDRPKAEEALLARQKRMEKIHVRPLPAEDRQRFADQWHTVQGKFVDDPPGSIHEADGLVCDLMRARGYPMSDFEHRAEDLSVDYPAVVRNYRAAHAIATSHERGEASTEDLRRALVYYRDLFDELLEAHPAEARGSRR
jgi:hypothetical protein